jgi:lysozyme family protein
MTLPLTDELRTEYQQLFETCEIRQDRLAAADAAVTAIAANRARYEAAGTPLGIPWYFVGAIHNMESSLSFTRHLHNGDPLTRRTVHVPKGRPAAGQPPFTWEQSAADALTLEGLNEVTDWTLAGTLYQMEKYNGFGYRTLHPEVLSPYLWSATNHYSKGKYVTDGTFDPDAVSRQSGAAAILRRMADRGIVWLDHEAAVIAALGAEVTYSTTRRSDEAKALQNALNSFLGMALKTDGVPGPLTSEAFQKVTGHLLRGDPRG